MCKHVISIFIAILYAIIVRWSNLEVKFFFQKYSSKQLELKYTYLKKKNIIYEINVRSIWKWYAHAVICVDNKSVRTRR